ncbi:MAG: transporter [Rhizobiales bacterium]|nr:transporter [Hyphomicrobiales bacterium]
MMRQTIAVGTVGADLRLRFLALGIVCAATIAEAPKSYAYDLPVVNLGMTTFLDGTPTMGGPGWYTSQWIISYSANKLANSQGNSLGLPVERVSVMSEATQILYLSPTKVGPGSFGFDFVVPSVFGASANDGLGNQVLNANRGFADVSFGAFYQFDPIMGPNGPLFIGRIEAQALAPIGRYNAAVAVNPGSNFWSFNPYFAGTLFLSPKWTVTTRFHYLWNGENNDPSLSYGPSALTSQAGQALHANFSTEYAVTDKFWLGINGYWLQQMTNTKVNDISVDGTKERVWALGPGMMYAFNKDNYLFFNAFYEFGAVNRTQGQKYMMRYVRHWD